MDEEPERATPSAEPLWFGPAGRPLFGWLHLPPDKAVRAGVVICPPLGVEALSAQRGLKLLAERLAAGGLATLRLDYDGTGNSAGEESDPGRLVSWVASVQRALQLLRDAGAPELAVVGLRMGALIAALAGADSPLDAAVLWDPCVTGRSFVREQVALRAVSIAPEVEGAAEGPGEPGAVEILGSVLSPQLVADLDALELTSIEGPVAKRVLALVRAERPPRSGVGEHLQAWDADVLAVSGQDELVDALPDSSRVPERTLGLIAGWLESCFAELIPEPLRRVETLGETALVARGVHERARRIGPLGLFAVESAPVRPGGGPTVIFLNAGLIHHSGPSRMWVTLSRRLAAAGMRAVRFDLSGLGESAVRPGQRPHLVYPAEACEDVAEAVALLESENPAGIVLSGLCSGAYHAIECGIALPVRAVVPINPWMNFDPDALGAGGGIAEEDSPLRLYDGWIRALLRFRRLVDLGDRHAPPALWCLLSALHLYTSPAEAIEQLAGRGVEVMLICGDLESRQFTRRGRWTMRRLERSGLVRLEVLPRSDHTLFGAAARAEAIELFCGYVLSRFGPRSASS